MEKWYNMSWTEVVNLLNSNSRDGLNIEQAKLIHKLNERLKEPFEVKYENKIKISHLIKVVFNLWFWVVAGSIVMLLVSAQYLLAFCFFILGAVNIFFFEVKRHRARVEFQNFSKLMEGTCSVIRQGKITKVSSKELVKGDIVYFSKGDIVPADIRIIESDNLKVMQNLITGEDFPVDKYETRIEESEVTLREMKNMLFKTSQIIKGEGKGIVVQTQGQTEADNNFKSVCENWNKFDDSFIENKLLLASKLSLVSMAVAVISNLAVLEQKNLYVMLQVSSRALAYSSMVGIPIICMLVVRLADYWLKRQNIYLKDAAWLKKINTVNVLCLDKMRGLSEEKMVVRYIYTNDAVYKAEEKIDLNQIDENFSRLIHISLLCMDFKLGVKEHPSMLKLMDDAVESFWSSKDVQIDDIRSKFIRRIYMPNDSGRTIQTSVNKVDTNYRAYSKGPVDEILKSCRFIMKNGVEKELTEEDIENIKHQDMIMCGEALSTLGFAYRSFYYEPTTQENIESNMVFVGVIGFENPIRKEAKNSISTLLFNNIKPIIFTEENKLAAVQLSKSLKLSVSQNSVLTDIELEHINDEELSVFLRDVYIFSRISSKSKARVMKALKHNGENTLLITGKASDSTAISEAFMGITTNLNNSFIKGISDLSMASDSLESIIGLFNISRRINQYLGCIVGFNMFVILSQTIIFILKLLFNITEVYSSLNILWFNLIITAAGSFIIFSGFRKNVSEAPVHEVQGEKCEKVYSSFWKDLLYSSLLSGIYIFSRLKINMLVNKDLIWSFALSLCYIFAIFIFYKKCLKR